MEPKVANAHSGSENDHNLGPKVASVHSGSENDHILEPKVANAHSGSENDHNLGPKVAGVHSGSENDHVMEPKVAENNDRLFVCDLEPKVVDDNSDTYPLKKKQKLNDELNEELRKSNRIKKQVRKNYYEGNLWKDNCLLYAHSEFDETPKSYSEIDQRYDKDAWFEAIEAELESHKLNNTWTLVKAPKDKNIIDNKWHFTIKHDQFGKPVRHKARLVARGFTQEYMVDYTETFAPVARITSFRFMVAFANQNNLLLHHMDVKTAFLNGDLQEEIFMEPPEHFKCKPGLVCKLNKSLYGLKQAARCWYQKLDFVLKQKGFVNSQVEKCIYILDKKDMTQNIYIVLYVDDLVIVSASKRSICAVKDYLNSKFQMVDLGELNFFVGICIERSDELVQLSQIAYIKKILKKFGMEDCKPVSTPLPAKLDFDALNSENNIDAPCRNLIGCLMYLMLCSRPDLSASVSILSRYSTKNNMELWQCLKRVLRYLKGTLELKLQYKRNDSFTDLLQAYVDSDWGGSDSERKSTTGFVFKMYESCTISWCTKKQNSVAASSTEAEYMALFEAVREGMWLRSLARSMLLQLTTPIKIYEDNMGCISIANNPTGHKRTKHIDIKYHFSREQVENDTIILEYIPTGKQLADALTKTLVAPRFIELRTAMGLV